MQKSPEIRTIDNIFYKAIGEVIRVKRIKLGMTLKDLSKLVGISRTTLDYYELGSVKMKPENLNLICEALQIDPNIEVEIKAKDSV